MNRLEAVRTWIRKNKPIARLIDDRRYRTVTAAVCSLIFNLFFSFYHGLIGFLSSSLLLVFSSVYYFLLALMRFSAVVRARTGKAEKERGTVRFIGVLLIVLSFLFHVMVIVGMVRQSAVSHGTVTMLAIATFTFTKLTAAIVSAVRHRREVSPLMRAIRAIRYSEIAVSLLTMQQSMLASFGDASLRSSVILNACTGAGVYGLILALGIVTLKRSCGKKQSMGEADFS